GRRERNGDAGIRGAVFEGVSIVAAIAGARRTGAGFAHVARAGVARAQAGGLLQAVAAECAAEGYIGAEVANATACGAGGGEDIQGPTIQLAGDGIQGVVGDEQGPGAVDVRPGFAAKIAELAFGPEGAEEGRRAGGNGCGRIIIEGGAL